SQRVVTAYPPRAPSASSSGPWYDMVSSPPHTASTGGCAAASRSVGHGHDVSPRVRRSVSGAGCSSSRRAAASSHPLTAPDPSTSTAPNSRFSSAVSNSAGDSAPSAPASPKGASAAAASREGALLVGDIYAPASDTYPIARPPLAITPRAAPRL